MSLTNSHRVLLLGYGSLLATVAGFVNAVAILTLAIPVGNLTATTTRLGMDAASPWLFESSVLAFILIGFLMGAACAGATLAPAKTHAGVRHSAVMIGEALLLALAFAWSDHTLSVLLAAIACGLQNGTTSSLRTMQIRTTHFTGTVTDLGLIIGRSRLHGVDRWRAAVLSATVITFITGSIAGTILGSRIGEAALLVPAVVCVGIAIAGLAYGRRRPRRHRRAGPTTHDSVPARCRQPPVTPTSRRSETARERCTRSAEGDHPTEFETFASDTRRVRTRPSPYPFSIRLCTLSAGAHPFPIPKLVPLDVDVAVFTTITKHALDIREPGGPGNRDGEC